MESNQSSVLNSLLSPGNFSRGEGWYNGLFENIQQDSLLVDMSTQYWLYPEQVIENTLKAYDPTFIIIKRKKTDQLVSYVSHLRRGHIDDDPIVNIYNTDPNLSNYLDRMASWNEDYEIMKSKYPGLNFIDISFEELVSNPVDTIKKVIPGISIPHDLNCNVHKNQKSYPRFALLNKLVFSNTARKLGRVLPQFMYASLMKLRKEAVKINLKKGESKYFDDDKSFVIKTYK